MTIPIIEQVNFVVGELAAHRAIADRALMHDLPLRRAFIREGDVLKAILDTLLQAGTAEAAGDMSDMHDLPAKGAIVDRDGHCLATFEAIDRGLAEVVMKAVRHADARCRDGGSDVQGNESGP